MFPFLFQGKTLAIHVWGSTHRHQSQRRRNQKEPHFETGAVSDGVCTSYLSYLIPLSPSAGVTVRTLTTCFPTNILKILSFIYFPFCLFLIICKKNKCLGDKNISISLIPDKSLGLLQYLHDVSSKCKVTIVSALEKAHLMMWCSYFQPTPWFLPYP